MIYNNNEIIKNKLYMSKLVFSLILILYFAGLCSGCAFTLKNAENIDFAAKITLSQNIINMENSAIFVRYIKSAARDISFILIMLTLKYSGVLKGMCLCVPFITALQNGCIYVVNYIKGKSLKSLIFEYIIKDTAISFLIILFCYVIISEIISGRKNIKKDRQKTSVYIIGILRVYIIDYVIKFFTL